MDELTDKFIQRVLEVLPEEGLKKLEAMIDNDSVSEEAVNALLDEHGIDAKTIIKEIGEQNG